MKKTTLRQLQIWLLLTVLLVTGAAVAFRCMELLFPERTASDFANAQCSDCTAADGHTVVVTGADPYIVMAPETGRIMNVRMDIAGMNVKRPGMMELQMFYDSGAGFREEESQKTRARTGSQFFTTDLGVHIHTLRFDFGYEEGAVIDVERLVINQKPGKMVLYALAYLVLLMVLAALLGSTGSTNMKVWLYLTVYLIALLTVFSVFRYPSVQYGRAIFLAGGTLFVLAALMIKAAEAQSRILDTVFIVLLLAAAGYAYLYLHVHTPFGDAPDESMRYDVVNYIYRHGTLPRGDDPEIRHPLWGFSYAFNPIFPYILAGFAQRLIAPLLPETEHIFVVARLMNILWALVFVWLMWRIGRRMFDGTMKYVLPFVAAFFPCLGFIASYISTESFSLMTTALIILFWLRGMESNWALPDCIGLAAGLALCLLTYYNGYGIVLVSVPLFFLTIRGREEKRGYVLRRGAFVTVLTTVLAGWWFIRNMILYGGDPLARGALNASQEMYASDLVRELTGSTPSSLGVSMKEMLFGMGWLRRTFQTFFGGFSLLRVTSKGWLIDAYKWIFAAAGLGLVIALFAALWRKFGKGESLHGRGIFMTGILITAVFPFVISVLYSYSSDYQAQGRYLMPGFAALACLLCSGFEAVSVLVPGQSEGAGKVRKQLGGMILMLMYLALTYFTAVDTVFAFYR